MDMSEKKTEFKLVQIQSPTYNEILTSSQSPASLDGPLQEDCEMVWGDLIVLTK